MTDQEGMGEIFARLRQKSPTVDFLPRREGTGSCDRTCITCHETKSSSEFYAHRATGKLFAECKDCSNTRSRRWFAKNGFDRREENYDRIKRNRKANPRALLLRQAKSRAKRRGIEFSITAQDVVWNEICPVFGFPLIYGGSGTRKANLNAASLDRVDNSKGYIPNNVVVISYRANCIKRDATPDELRALVDWLNRMAIDVKHET